MVYICMSVINILGPEFNRDCWLSEKFNLGLDFPNVGNIYKRLYLLMFLLNVIYITQIYLRLICRLLFSYNF